MNRSDEKLIKSIRILARADYEDDQPGVAYVEVEYAGKTYNLQFTRPRHPYDIGKTLKTGAAMKGDEGHDPNAYFLEALPRDADIARIARAIARKASVCRALKFSELR